MTLTTEQKNIIAATVPILEAGGETLTRHFYARMMKLNPEVRKFFNQTHQKDGTQAKSLAKAVLFYAKNIDNLQNLGAIAPIIIEKHVALNIKPEHYPIVGTNLISAMKEVLGPEVATPAVIDAWTKAYFQLADILIEAEKKEYEKLTSAEGGWSDFRKFVLKKKTLVAKNIVSFWLEPEDGKKVLVSKPGQYITLKVVVDGQECRRNYSVSSAPSSKGYQITVKNIGLVSGYLHSLNVGDVIDLRPPVGNFLVEIAEKNSPLVFIAGGVGITPLAAMLFSGAKGKLLYYAHNDEERAFLKEFNSLDNVEYIKVAESRPSAAELKQHIDPNAFVFYTGPLGFMKSVASLLKGNGISDDRARYELFGSGQAIE